MAYGAVAPPAKTGPLDVRLYRIPPRALRVSSQAAAILAVPFDVPAGDKVPNDLEATLCDDFNKELEKGVTYPQRGPMSVAEFRGYFLGADVIVGIVISQEEAQQMLSQHCSVDSIEAIAELGTSLGALAKDSILRGRDWSTQLGFSYYIKPNYPGRSSHLCNAGFVVPPSQRGRGLGGVAGKSFVHYGPLAGYRGSVFNLVYVNNVASVQIWERLGFERVGRIPGAGLLRVASESTSGEQRQATEDYVDAWVIYGDFVKLAERQRATAPAISK